MRINSINSFLKLNHPFRKTSTGQKDLSYIGPAIWKRIPEIFKKTRNLNTFKHTMRRYYLNNLSNPNLWNVGRFDYTLAIIKNIFLFIIQIFEHPFFLFPASLWLKVKIRLFACFVLSLPYCFLSLILLLISTFFSFVVIFSFFFLKFGYLIIFVPIWIFCFYGKTKPTYLMPKKPAAAYIIELTVKKLAKPELCSPKTTVLHQYILHNYGIWRIIK